MPRIENELPAVLYRLRAMLPGAGFVGKLASKMRYLNEAVLYIEASMAIASTDPAAPATIYPVARPLTAADLAAMPKELPSGPVDFELDHGRLVQMSPPGRRHGKLQGRIVREFINQGEANGHGEAN